MATANEVLGRAYRDEWIVNHPNSANCSGFLKSLGKQLGVAIPDGNADAIVVGLAHGQDWLSLGMGVDALRQSTDAAFAGRLVLVGVTSQDYGKSNGHIAVLLPRLAGPKNAPLVYGGGSAQARSTGDKTIRQVFQPRKLDVVRCFQHAKVGLGQYE